MSSQLVFVLEWRITMSEPLMLEASLELSRTDWLLILRTKAGEYFLERGYKIVEPVPIVQTQMNVVDSDVSLVGSTTNVLKRFLTNLDSVGDGLYLFQSKVRTQNISQYFTDTDLVYASAFTGFGLWVLPNDYVRMCEDVASFLVNVIGLPRESMQITSSYTYIDLWKPWRELEFRIQFDPDEERFLWKFGTSPVGDLCGEGLYVDLVDPQTGLVIGDLASIEIVRSSIDGRPFVFEMGLGFETITARYLSTQQKDLSPIWCTSAADHFKVSISPETTNFLDALNTVGILLANGIDLKGRQKGSGYGSTILKRFLSAVKFYAVEGKFEKYVLKKTISGVLGKTHSLPTEIVDNVLSSTMQYIDRFNFFTEAVTRFIVDGDISDHQVIPGFKQARDRGLVFSVLQSARESQLENLNVHKLIADCWNCNQHWFF